MRTLALMSGLHRHRRMRGYRRAADHRRRSRSADGVRYSAASAVPARLGHRQGLHGEDHLATRPSEQYAISARPGLGSATIRNRPWWRDGSSPHSRHGHGLGSEIIGLISERSARRAWRRPRGRTADARALPLRKPSAIGSCSMWSTPRSPPGSRVRPSSRRAAHRVDLATACARACSHKMHARVTQERPAIKAQSAAVAAATASICNAEAGLADHPKGRALAGRIAALQARCVPRHTASPAPCAAAPPAPGVGAHFVWTERRACTRSAAARSFALWPSRARSHCGRWRPSRLQAAWSSARPLRRRHRTRPPVRACRRRAWRRPIRRRR